MSDDEHLLSSKELADLLGKSDRTIHRMAREGDLPVAHRSPGDRGSFMFRLSDVRPLINARVAEWEHHLEHTRAVLNEKAGSAS
ncbi:MAG: helix-turn-helix transcriptional regulator [Acidimicrobiales bacterium]